ncbi:MAG: TIGR00725 family protein [Candidatus Cloacimonetes bacterium]|nr:TIGR00725 family protein [Candidatus Cloacimonadota bacterium]
MKKKIIAVIGGKSANQDYYDFAYQVGKLIADNGHILICGGLGGVMEAASKGASENGGFTIGILPGFEKKDANPYISISIVTGISTARNSIIARTCDLAIAINGSYGTLSEIAYCLDFGKTVLGYKTHDVKGIISIDKPEEIKAYL